LAIRTVGALLLLAVTGCWMEVPLLRRIHLESFHYTSPSAHQRAKAIPLTLLTLGLILLVAPLPLHPLLLPLLITITVDRVAYARRLSMKQ
jgi:hypothetical protein